MKTAESHMNPYGHNGNHKHKELSPGKRAEIICHIAINSRFASGG
jgi:hypothetical protein